MAETLILTLMSRLKVEYLNHLQEQGKSDLPVEQAIAVDGFADFCERYLSGMNKPATVWYADDGIGLIMADQTRVTLNRQDPLKANSGQMQPSGAVDVMEGKGFGNGGVPI